MKIGIIGCGNIVGAYINHSKQFLDIMQIAAFADVDQSRTVSAAEKYGNHAIGCSVDELLSNPEVDLVVNLTPPAAHAEIAMKVLSAGKHVYNEKPLAILRKDAQAMMALAVEKGLRIGGAPDTFLGPGIQTAMKALDDGLVGRPVAAFAQMAGHGMESWHPNPEFFYQFGGGPMFDIGPYILTTLVALLGPVKRITGSTRISFPERTITSKERYGQTFKVEVPTHITGSLDFANGAIATVITSFDMWRNELPRIEIYGSLGTLSVPDPNQFMGEVKMWRPEVGEWEIIPLLDSRIETGRSIGVADMVCAIRDGRPHRANNELAFHVLDLMHAIHEASDDNEHKFIGSTCTRPAPLTEELK